MICSKCRHRIEVVQRRLENIAKKYAGYQDSGAAGPSDVRVLCELLNEVCDVLKGVGEVPAQKGQIQ